MTQYTTVLRALELLKPVPEVAHRALCMKRTELALPAHQRSPAASQRAVVSPRGRSAPALSAALASIRLEFWTCSPGPGLRVPNER
jgi:hypothetical protein